jgi:7-carboxy-7-deazaguanine synthase
VRETQLYDINDIYPTIQGEGCLAGAPMMLIRQQGCALGCGFCDTKETWHKDPDLRHTPASELPFEGRNHLWAQLPADRIAARARAMAGDRMRWALVTGGEPAQQRLKSLVDALHDEGFFVALETSGTADGLLGAGCDWVCVSPKVNNPGHRPILNSAIALANEIKFVIGKPDDVEILRYFCSEYGALAGSATDRGARETEWCIQPMSQNQNATDLCIELAKREGFRLSIQIHKYIVADGSDRCGEPLDDRERGGLLRPKSAGYP